MANGIYRGVRLSEAEDRDLAALAECNGCSISDALRIAIRDAGKVQGLQQMLTDLETTITARIAQAEQRITATTVTEMLKRLPSAGGK